MELVRLAKLAHGTLSYNLNLLESRGLVRIERSKSATRYYQATTSTREASIIDVLRQDSKRQIVEILLENRKNGIGFGDLVARCGKSRSTISAQVKTLSKRGIVKVTFEGRRMRFRIGPDMEIDRILSQVKNSLRNLHNRKGLADVFALIAAVVINPTWDASELLLNGL